MKTILNEKFESIFLSIVLITMTVTVIYACIEIVIKATI